MGTAYSKANSQHPPVVAGHVSVAHVLDAKHGPTNRNHTPADHENVSADPEHAPAKGQHQMLDGGHVSGDAENESAHRRGLRVVAPSAAKPPSHKTADDGGNVTPPRKRALQELLQNFGMPDSLVASFLSDVSRDDELAAILRANLPQEKADLLLAKVVTCVFACESQTMEAYIFLSIHSNS